jgi:hypothetical protein
VQGTSAYSFLKLNQAQAGVNLAAVAWYELKEAEGETPLTLTFVTLDGSCFQVHDDEARTLFTQLQSLSLPDNQKRQEALKNVLAFLTAWDEVTPARGRVLDILYARALEGLSVLGGVSP